MDDTDATAPGPDIPAAATRDSAIADQQGGSVASVLQRSWEDLYKAEMPRLVRYLMKCFGDSGMRDAADAAHYAFVELFTKWDTVRSPRAWLRTVAFRQAKCALNPSSVSTLRALQSGLHDSRQSPDADLPLEQSREYLHYLATIRFH